MFKSANTQDTIQALQYIAQEVEKDGFSDIVRAIDTAIRDLQLWQNACADKEVSPKDLNTFIHDQRDLIFDDLMLDWLLRRNVKRVRKAES